MALVALCALFMAGSRSGPGFQSRRQPRRAPSVRATFIAVLAVYGLPFAVVHHRRPLQSSTSILTPLAFLPLGYDLYIAEELHLPLPLRDGPRWRIPRPVVSSWPSRSSPTWTTNRSTFRTPDGNWLTIARQYETNGLFAELVWTGMRWVSAHLE